MISYPYRPSAKIALEVNEKTVIERGEIVALTAGGLAVPATDRNAAKIVGRADQRADNSGGNTGDMRVEVIRRRAFLFPNSSGTDEVKRLSLFEKCYFYEGAAAATDDGGNRLELGTVVELSDEGVWVEI